MQIRKSFLEMFSTFLRFNNEWDGTWVYEPRLKRSMSNCLESSVSELSEEFWVLYWHKISHSQTPQETLATSHLLAYLQESAYWSARKILSNVTKSTSLNSVADFFQVALSKAQKIIKGFNSTNNGSFKKYASFAFVNIIKEELRIRGEVDICTPWALLSKISNKKLVESLHNINLKQEIIDCYVLAWQCFKTVHTFSEARTTRKIPEPDGETWLAIANLYNAQRLNHATPLVAASPSTIKNWITGSALVVRNYLYPKFVSVDAPLLGQEDGQLLDKLPTFEASGLTRMIALEEEKVRVGQRNKINEVLLEAIQKLDSQAQNILGLYYGEAINQQKIAEKLQIKQYTVSRRLSTYKQTLLLALAQWSKTALHESLDSNVLNNLSAVLEEWLKNYYNHPEGCDSLS